MDRPAATSVTGRRAGWLDGVLLPRLLRLAASPPAKIVAVLAALLFVAIRLTHLRLAEAWPLVPHGDSQIVFDTSRAILARGGYATGEIFPYPPSAVLIFAALTLGGGAAFTLLWQGLMTAGLALSVWAALAHERPALRAAWPLVGALAVLLADSPVNWDLINHNSNLIYLGMVMAAFGLLRRSPVASGALVALSVSFKLYSVLLLAWLIVNGPRRAAITGLAGVLALWIALPALVFGPAHAISLYGEWRAQLAAITSPAAQSAFAAATSGPPLVTLERAVVTITRSPFGSPQAAGWLAAIWAVWAAALAWYAWRWRRCWPTAGPSRGALADWVVLLLAPLPLSPWLEPYHAIPTLVGALLCVVVTLDAEARPADRIAALLGLLPLLALRMVGVPFAERGIGLLAQFLGLVLALAWMRPRLAGHTPPAQAGNVARGWRRWIGGAILATRSS